MAKRKGFTLIEMLVVIGIIGLLSAVVVIGLSGARASARDSKRIADINQIQNWLELNYHPVNGYPTADFFTDNVPLELQDQFFTIAYEPIEANGGRMYYNLGVCLEREAFDTGSDNCPTPVQEADCAFFFCTTVRD